MNITSVIAALSVILVLAGSGYGQTAGKEDREQKKYYLYQWTDSKGTVHITDSFGKVPERYRSKALKLESRKGPEGSPEQDRGRSGGSDDSDLEETESAAKFEWQQRIRDQQRRLENAEKRYQKLERERDELFVGSSALTSIENRVKFEQLGEQLKQVQSEIDAAKNMLHTVIPEEARKAGVPPGWLRE
ncbi:MAG: hypothetical protein A2078_03760 [Nitrospirae bacterium GWC2_57_9]|nr:MAG: hypothetical protein A2078_03760 [Nitrospirae bacterium GWC2_57_9]